MHELSLAQALVDQVTELAHQDGCSRILAVDVRIGALSGVMRDALEFCFPAAARGTALEGAVLRVTEVPLKALCRDCRCQSQPEPFEIQCPHCGSMDLELSDAREFSLVSLEVE
jgi:hydrogenase nickel incorporation protein HypA/HybF